MIINHQQKLFMIDERERFKKRKSKKYKNLCSVALTTLAVAGVATATTVKADETAGSVTTTAVTTTTETPTSTPVVVESPAPATNLTEAQPQATPEALATQNSSNTQAGNITVTNNSETLNTAVSQAEEAGVIVQEEATKDYGVTTSVEETQAKQADIQADYAKQAENISKVTENYVAEKEKHATETAKVIDENKKLKADYDAKIATYNQDVTKVNETNATIDAAYDKARQAYETEVSKVNATNVEREANYKQAQATYQSETERIQRSNDKKRLAYEVALAEYNTAQAALEAENQAIAKRNQAATEAYNQAMAAYTTEKQKYDDAVAKAKANTSVDGNLSEVVAQNLIFKREPNASVAISGQQTFFTWTDGDDGLGVINASKEQHVGAGHTVATPNWVDVLAPGGTGGGTGETGRVQATVFGLGKGESTTVSYTNLENSSYAGRKISRVDYTYTVLSSPSVDESFTMVVYKDPTITTYFGTAKNGDAMRDGKIQMDVTYYYEDGSPVIFGKDAALLSFSSLNQTELPIGEQEYVTGLSNVTPIQITGSSVVYQDGKLGALGSNHSVENGSKFNRSDWDSTADNPNSYYGAGAAKVNSGTKTISFVIGNHPIEAGTRGILRQWFQFNSEVRTLGGIIPNPPKEPTLKQEDPKSSTVRPPTTPNYEALPQAPTVSYLSTSQAPVKDPSVPLPVKPEEPTYKTLPTAPAVPRVSYHLATLTTQPQTAKAVETTEGVDIDRGLVAKGQEVVFDLTVSPLPANRSLTTSGKLTDPLPKGFVLNLEKTANNAKGYDLSYSEANHVLFGDFTKDTLLAVNQDLTKPGSLPSFKVYGWTSNDAATYKNAYTLTLNGGEGHVNGYTRTSNTVVIHTPGDPNDPDNPSNNEILPLKTSTNAAGVKIDGKVVPVGSTIYYTVELDYDQYAGIKVDTETIAKGFASFDDYPEEALTPDLAKSSVTVDGKPIRGVTLKQHDSVSGLDATTKGLLDSSTISSKIKGKFISAIADNPTDYFNTIVSKGKKVLLRIPMVVKDSLYNTGKDFSNTAYQVDFGNGYMTNTVTNTTPVVTPSKVNTNAQGVLINGKYVLAGSVNYYKVSLDYSAYKGIEADPSLIAQGFFGVDDVPEEALTVENSGIQLIASDNSLVKGVTSTVYASLAQAPKAVQEAMVKQGFKPKGVILVLSADSPEDYYNTYVKTGMKIEATLPMTVKTELAKTGAKYENTAYQIDFGSAYVTDTVVNNVPKLDPKKDVVIDLTHDTTSLGGKDIEVGTTFNYKLGGATLPADRGSSILSYTWTDKYDKQRDQYDGVYKIFAPMAFKTKDGIAYAARTELTRFSLQTVDTETGMVKITLDEDFLASIDDLSVFKADAYLQMKRIGTGDVTNTFSHGVNGAEVDSNTVITHSPVGSVLVNFLEEGTGKVLKPQVMDEKDVATGTDYDTTDRKVTEIVTEDGKTYELVRTAGKEQGKVVKGHTTIDYLYKEVLGDVTVSYKDKDGNVIKEPVVDTPKGSTGRDYNTTDHKLEEIVTADGKTYKLVPELTEGKEEGKVVKGNTSVTYVYEEVKVDVVVHYVDEDGNVIKKPVKDVDQGSTGTNYDTTDNKPEMIEVDGVKYKLMPKKTIGQETGKLSKEGAEVTYVYHKIVTNWIEEGTKTKLKDQEDGEKDCGSFDGYDYVTTEVDKETGDITHIFKKTPKSTPAKPQPKVQDPAPAQPVQAASVAKAVVLPATGESDTTATAALGLVGLIATGLGLSKRRKEEN